MAMLKHTRSWNEPLRLESGETLQNVSVTFHTSGTYDPKRSKVIWVCHALTADSDPSAWWPGLFGAGDWFDRPDHFVVCAGMLGSPYNATHALSDRGDGEPYYHEFPAVTIRDMVTLHERLREVLGIERIHTLIGASMGGQQVLEWAVQCPDRVDHLVAIATNAFHSPWGIAFNESQRMAIEADTTWTTRSPEAGLQGLKAARSLALLSYRNYRAYTRTQEDPMPVLNGYRAASYQRYQGEKLAQRFDAFGYHVLSRAMDSHHIGRDRGGVAAALQHIRARTLVVSMQDDQLFPESEQHLLARHIAGARHVTIPTAYGHDGFLIETEQLVRVLRHFYAGSTYAVLEKTTPELASIH